MEPQITKIINWIIGILITMSILGFLWYWFYLRGPLPTVPNHAQTSTSTQQSGDTGSTQTPPANNTATGGATVVGSTQMQAAYAALFSRLNAQQLSFANVGAGATGDTAGLYGLYAKDVADAKQIQPGLADYPVEVAFVDLNNDNNPEAIVYEDLPGFCGSAGCTLEAYQLKSGSWTKILSTSASGDIIGISSGTTGYANLFITVPGSVGSQPNVMWYGWSGSSYEAQRSLAVWSGQSFELVP